MTISVNLQLTKETKGAVRYEEGDWKSHADYKIGTLYIRKTALTAPFPKEIKVTVEGA
jgi:hypothetical protein